MVLQDGADPWYLGTMSGPEDRRRHVRVHPTSDYGVDVSVVEGIVYERARVVDISVAGLGLLLESPFDGFGVGQKLTVRIALPEAPVMEVAAVVRHMTHVTGIWGIEIDRADEAAMRALSQAVSALLERATSG